MSIVNTVSILIFVLSLKKLINLSAKIQAIEKSNKTGHREIQAHTEEFNGEPVLSLHYKNREEQSKVFSQPTLIYPVALQKLPNGRSFVTANWTPEPLLDFRNLRKQ